MTHPLEVAMFRAALRPLVAKRAAGDCTPHAMRMIEGLIADMVEDAESKFGIPKSRLIDVDARGVLTVKGDA